jgi:hypothetical protein
MTNRKKLAKFSDALNGKDYEVGLWVDENCMSHYTYKNGCSFDFGRIWHYAESLLDVLVSSQQFYMCNDVDVDVDVDALSEVGLF